MIRDFSLLCRSQPVTQSSKQGKNLDDRDAFTALTRSRAKPENFDLAPFPA
jgi:hypothetical protein